MNLIFLLLVLIFLVLLLDLLLSDGDIFAPPCMLCVIYFICVLLSLYNYEFWSLQAFQSQTVGIIFAALCVFSIVYFCLNFLLYGKRAGKSRKPLTPEECRSRVIPYRAKAFRLTVAFQTLVVAISALTILRLGSGSSWAYILASYKQSMYSGEVSLPEYLEWCNRFCGALGYLYLYIFVNNAVMQRSFRKNLKYLVPVVLHVVRSIVTGNRYNLLAVLAGGVYGFYILYQLRTGWKKTFRMKYLFWGVGGLVLVLAAFVALKRAAGRTDNIDPIYYISMYASGSIKLFDWYLADPVAKSTIWGKETFSGLNNFLGNRGIGQTYDINLEFRFIGKTNLGNVYGALRRYYQDFGFGGAMVLVGLASGIWSVLYAKLTYARNRNRGLLLILFMYMVNALMIMPIDDKFYTNLATPSFVIDVAIFILMYRMIILKKRRKRHALR